MRQKYDVKEVTLDDPETDQESMLDIRGIEVAGRFDFTPQPDITASELARLIALFRFCIELSAEQMERLEADPNLLRHLTKR